MPSWRTVVNYMVHAVSDTVLDVVAGRKPISAFQDQVKKWRSGGGDQMRAEYEASIAGK